MAASAREASSVASGVPEEDKVEEEAILDDRERGFQASEPALHQSELMQTQVRSEMS